MENFNYKAIKSDGNTVLIGKESPEDPFIPYNIDNEEHDEFLELLDKLISDIVDSDPHIIALINRFREMLIQFFEKKDLPDYLIFKNYNTPQFLIDHTSSDYFIEVREVSLMSIATFLALFPQYSDTFIYSNYLQILNDIFQNHLDKEIKILLNPAYKGFGNIIQNLQNNKFETNLFNYFFKSIDLDCFIQSVRVIEVNERLCFNYAIFSIFRQCTIALSKSMDAFLFTEEQIFEILTLLSDTIRSKISEKTCSNKLHSYALSAIDLFIKSDLYSEDFRNEAIKKSKIYLCINSYFKIDTGIIREKSLVLSIISTFYMLEIPDTYNLIENIFPFLLDIVQDQEKKHRSKYIRRVCDAIKVILDSSSRFDALEYFYSIDALEKLTWSLDHTKKFEEKTIIIGTIAIFAQINYETLPFNSFFFTDECIENFLNLLESEDVYDKSQAIKALFNIFDVSQIEGNTDQIIQILDNNDEISTIQNLNDFGNDYISSYSIRIWNIIAPFLEN